jgi:hypothetical protein
MDLSFFLENLLGRKVELVTLQSLSPYINPHILKEVERAVNAVNGTRYSTPPPGARR